MISVGASADSLYARATLRETIDVVGITWKKKQFMGEADATLSVTVKRGSRTIDTSSTVWRVPSEIEEFRMVQYRNTSTAFVWTSSTYGQSAKLLLWAVHGNNANPLLLLEATNGDTAELAKKGVVIETSIAMWVDKPPPAARNNARVRRVRLYNPNKKEFDIGPWTLIPAKRRGHKT
jgi:hypothetical protein